MIPQSASSRASGRVRGLVSSTIRALDPNPLLLVLAVVVMTAVACQNWMFDPLGNTDAFKYVGMFISFEHIDPAIFDYKTSRLPWILPGFVSYHLFGPVVGHYVLQMTFLSAAAVLLYLGVRLAFGRDIALITAAILVTYSFFHGPTGFASGGWSYHNTAAITYYFGTFYGMMRAVSVERGYRSALCAGICGALCFFTTLFMVPFVAVVTLVVLASRGSLRSALRLVPWFIAGMAITTAGLAAANMAFGRPAAFFMPEVMYIAEQAQKNVYYLPFTDYAGTATWLVYPLMTILLVLLSWGCAWLFPTRVQGERRLIFLWQLQFLLHAVHMIAVTELLHQSVLNFAFMVIPIAGPMSLALAASLASLQRYPRSSSNIGIHTMVAVGVVTILVLGLRMGTPAVKGQIETWLIAHSSLIERTVSQGIPVVIPIVAGCALILLIPLFGVVRVGLVGVALSFATLNLLSYPAASPVCEHRRNCCNLRDAFESITDGTQYLVKTDPRGLSNRFIFKLDEFVPAGACGQVWLSQIFISLYSTRLAGTVYDWEKLPDLADQEIRGWTGITMASSVPLHDDFTKALTARAASSGMALRPVGTTVITHRRFQYKVTVFTAAPITPHP